MAPQDRSSTRSLEDWKRYRDRETRLLLQKQVAERKKAGQSESKLIDPATGVVLPPEAVAQRRPGDPVAPDVAHRHFQTEARTAENPEAMIPRFPVAPRRAPAPSAEQITGAEPELAHLDLNALADLPTDVRPLSAAELAAIETARLATPAPAPPPVMGEDEPDDDGEQGEPLDLFGAEAFAHPRPESRSPHKRREELIEDLLDPVISLEQAATILNVCKTTVRRYTNRGQLECVRTPGNQRRFRLSTVLKFVEEKDVKGIGKRGRKPGKGTGPVYED